MADLETSWNDIHACFCLKSWVSFCQMNTHCMSVFKLKLNCSITPWHKVQFYRRVFHRFMHSISFPVVGVWLLYISTISSVAPLLGRICGNPSFHPHPYLYIPVHCDSDHECWLLVQRNLLYKTEYYDLLDMSGESIRLLINNFIVMNTEL